MKYLSHTYKAILTSLALVVGFSATAQDTPLTFNQMEKVQDSIELLYVDIYQIIEDYPKMIYEYEFDGDALSSVSITGIDDIDVVKDLQNKLLELELLKQRMFNVSNRMGVYYVAETDASPVNGYEAFYENIREYLEYPERAEEYGIEGTVFVKFIVDSNGNVTQVNSAGNFESDEEYLTDKLLTEAENAVKATSGNWKPARVGGIPVAHWVVIPIQFSIDKDYYHPLNIRYSG